MRIAFVLDQLHLLVHRGARELGVQIDQVQRSSVLAA